MTAVAYRFRSELRDRWRSWIAVALVIGLAGGVVLALLAGARRTDDAYPRFLRTNDAYDVLLVSGIPGLFEFAPLDLDEIAHRSEVSDATPLRVVAMTGTAPDGTLITPGSANFGGDPTGRYGIELNRFKVLEGRLPDPDRPDEVVVGFPTVDEVALSVGDTLRVNVLDAAEAGAVFSGQTTFDRLATTGPLQDLEVVGIVAEPNGFPPASDPTVDLAFIYVTPSLLARNPEAMGVDALAVRLVGGAAAGSALIASLQEAAGDLPVSAATSAQQTASVQRALAPLSSALRVAGALAALVAALVVGQLLSRQAFVDGADAPTLRSLGCTRRDRTALRLMKAAAIGTIGAATAALVAIALSALFPVGLARKAEPDPGILIDVFVLSLGFAAILVTTLCLGGLTALGGATGPTAAHAELEWAAPGRVRRAAGVIQTAAPGPTSLAGTSMTAGQRGTAGAVVGVALGLLTVMGMLTFVASLHRLRESPALYGWTWDLIVGGDFGEPLDEGDIEELAHDQRIRSMDVGAYADLELLGRPVRALALDPRVGSLQPAVVDGRAPHGRQEVVLAPGEATELALGEATRARAGPSSVEVTVVGRAALPGVDILVPFDALQGLGLDISPQLVAITLVEGTDVDAFGRRATAALGLTPDNLERAELPQDLVNFGQADSAPLIVAALMALVAVGTLLHALLTAVQRERRTLAVLRTLGFTRRQLLAAVAWQSSLLVGAAVVLAVPIGVATGRWLWLTVAQGLGVVPKAVIPPVALAITVAAALLVGTVVAGIPAWRGWRVAPADTLRAD
ncbi:MAG: ABC transporter permease [Microthrixaceae bacterium]